MKTKIIITLISYVLLLSANKSFAQLALNKNNTDFSHPASATINTGVNEDTNAFNSKGAPQNIKVQRSFISYFGEDTENNWSVAGKDFHNRFHVNGLLTYALFAKNGELIYVITYGKEKNLPAAVRKIVKREYYDYNITTAIEVKQNDRDIWVVRLEDTSEIITVRIEDGEMEQVQKIQKAN